MTGASTDPDRDRLWRHAPILRFDARELFFPTSVEGFVEASTLWPTGRDSDRDGGPPSVVKPRVADLDGRWPVGTYLRFVSDDDRRRVLKHEVRRTARRLFSPRLGRVGLFGRLLDAIFLLTLRLRPTTPRLTTAAASVKAERLRLHDRPVMYCRSVRAGDWLVLHYTFLYVMNDWRTSYRGLNDHEGDWEQVMVFVDPATDRPVWVAASSHEHRGADLRRHWDDPELRLRGDRPVLFVGAGSHAVYFSPGDYVTRLDVPVLRWLLRLQRWSQQMLRITDEATEKGLGPALGAPFVDAATGDGREITDWRVALLDPSEPWLSSYRGLWGADTGDRTGGERGPAGPKFGRDGSIRASWADPVGFAGLHPSPPPSVTDSELNVLQIDRALSDVDEQIRGLSRLLALIGQIDTEDESRQLTDLMKLRVELDDHRRAVTGEAGPGQLRSHLNRPAMPLPPPAASGWILALWAALSVPLLMLCVAAMLLIQEVRFVLFLIAAGSAAVLLEQLARRRVQAVLRLGAAGAALVLFFVFALGLALRASRYALGVGFVIGAGFLFAANLSELHAVQQSRSRQNNNDQ